jgi:hypothetical protein
MTMRIVLAAALIAGGSSVALAQSSTATSGTTKPMATAPTSGSPPPVQTMPNGQPKWMPPPAARSGEKGLRTGEGAVTGEPVEIKRVK